MFTGTGYHHHVTPLLEELHGLMISYQAKFKVLLLVYTALYTFKICAFPQGLLEVIYTDQEMCTMAGYYAH